jgi:hypothetical protein
MEGITKSLAESSFSDFSRKQNFAKAIINKLILTK